MCDHITLKVVCPHGWFVRSVYRKVIWDVINNSLFLDTVAVEPTFVAFLLHSQTYVHGLSCPSFKFL